MSVSGTGRGRRLGLSRQRLIEAALQLIDRDGAETFSMRRLAAALDVEVMSLYNHVPNKEALLDGVVEAVLSEVDVTAATGTWENRIRAQAAAFRDAALAHPHAFLLVLTRPMQSLGALETVRSGIANIDELGFEPQQAVHALRTFTAYIVGTILRELESTLSFGETDPERVRQRIDEVVMVGDPALTAVAPYLAVCDHKAEFDYGIELLIAGLARRAPAGAGRET